MIENLDIPHVASKECTYRLLLPQLQMLTEDESDLIANMANIVSALKEVFNFFWVGFYRVMEGQLLLGPFQGPLACTRIAYGKGVCGIAWKDGKTIIVPDVEQFAGHITCSNLSRSEIVVPVKRSGAVVAVLDIDSDRLDHFDEVDRLYLEKIVALLS
ncbi:MAG: GAF domain-containing protein [Bacteroidales bacterium]|nr:GAF domain-containing protein [Bacteroidales bacterium]